MEMWSVETYVNSFIFSSDAESERLVRYETPLCFLTNCSCFSNNVRSNPTG